ncbi:hypothetical protein CHLRE_02g145502v5 [Chlamydomonas reinhardtii]|uniref:Uncharacterized protein n=1 Tax=Chlamydomonas reinhardtii TaxID=3055 RepID=A0A2K3E3S4_CHLRE|nr:uncharacterized protein CHLRE_02g145502v5 [Chlamydomonas reinhardtii]PNW87439.1 hypothetical protein CHLRE_02g145502v5 [Chlamydomonas reinhardtii]
MIVGSLDYWLGRQVESFPAPAHTAPIAIPPRPSSVSAASSTEEPVPINLERRYSLLTLELARKPSLEEPSRRCSALGLPRSTSQPAFEGRGWEHMSRIPKAKALSSPHHRAILSATHDEPAPWTADEDAVDDSVEQDPGGGAAGSCNDLLKYVLGYAEDAGPSSKPTSRGRCRTSGGTGTVHEQRRREHTRVSALGYGCDG